MEKALTFLATDEKAHFNFFKQCVEVYLKFHRQATIEQMRAVMHNFAMPAINDLEHGRQRVARIKSLGIFDEDMYYRQVYLPLLESLGVERQEMRGPRVKKSAVTSPLPE
ncbi:MAG: hypothetical protein KatS3mg105_1890 [Gemmatales bacterium]|nr:MAG: hypothetical protein KatS3mg105_1890 [Gemmatales bacterium]